MPLAVEAGFLKHNPSKTLVIGVAIDGSNMSDRALETACQFYNEKRKDKLVILHVSDSKKTFLPKNLQPKQLERQYVEKAFALHVRVSPILAPGANGHWPPLQIRTAMNQQHVTSSWTFARQGQWPTASSAHGSRCCID